MTLQAASGRASQGEIPNAASRCAPESLIGASAAADRAMDTNEAQTERGQQRQSAEHEMTAELGVAVAEKRRTESVKDRDRRDAEAEARRSRPFEKERPGQRTDADRRGR